MTENITMSKRKESVSECFFFKLTITITNFTKNWEVPCIYLPTILIFSFFRLDKLFLLVSRNTFDCFDLISFIEVRDFSNMSYILFNRDEWDSISPFTLSISFSLFFNTFSSVVFPFDCSWFLFVLLNFFTSLYGNLTFLHFRFLSFLFL